MKMMNYINTFYQSKFIKSTIYILLLLSPMDPIPVHKHKGLNYELQICCQHDFIVFDLVHKDRTKVFFRKNISYQQFLPQIQNRCQSLREIFDLLQGDQTMVIIPEKGIVTVMIKTLAKNKLVEIPFHIYLQKIKEGSVPQEFQRQFRELKEEVKILREKINLFIPEELKMNNDEQKMKLKGIQTSFMNLIEEQIKAIDKRLSQTEKQIREIKALILKERDEEKIKVEEIPGKDEFDERMKKFEKQARQKKKVIEEEAKKYQWKTEYSASIKGTYQGRGQNGKPHGYGILSNEQTTIYAMWVSGYMQGITIQQDKKYLAYIERKKGKTDGDYIYYSKDGKMLQRQYKKSKIDGIERRFRSDGSLQMESIYKGGERVSWVNY